MSTEIPDAKTLKANHYIDNAAFLAALLEHRAAVLIAKEAETALPPISNYLGDCFIKIARHLSYKSNFINYSYKDEMISDAIENCLAVVNNFDPAKSKNPFAYFTQITYFAFIRRIQREKKQLQTKYRYIDQLDLNELITQEQDNGEFNNQFLEYLKTQLDGYDYEKVVSPATKAAMKKKENEESVLDPNNEL
jgi:DNA-directed RNA polymerase specialized sigma24 family protein